VRAGYKKTEVGLIPVDWEVKPLKHISPSQSVGLVINPSSYFDDAGPVPILLGSNVKKDRIVSQSAKRISVASNHLLASSRLTAGDLVTVRVGEPGITAVIPPELDGCNCASMMIIRRHHSFDSHWLCHIMNSRIGLSQVQHVQYGTAQKQFNISDAINFRYPVPPLAEQHAIAEALNDANTLLQSLERLVHKKRHLKKGAMQELLTGKKRLPNFNQEWETHPISDCFELVNTRNTEINDNVLTISAQLGFVRQEEFFNKRVASTTLENYYLIERGHFAYNRSYSNGYPFGAIKRLTSYERGVVTTLYICFALRPDASADPAFFEHYFEAGLLNPGLAIVTNEGGRAHGLLNITKADFLSRELRLPPAREQTAIATILSDMDAEVTALESKLVKARQIKQGMMEEILTGRKRLV
jgi:type I restriction enzyme, S subunit